MHKVTDNKLRWSFRHGVNRDNLDKIFAYFAPGSYLSAYKYTVVETNDDTIVFDVIYNPETHTSHDAYLELSLVFRSLGLKVN